MLLPGNHTSYSGEPGSGSALPQTTKTTFSFEQLLHLIENGRMDEMPNTELGPPSSIRAEIIEALSFLLAALSALLLTYDETELAWIALAPMVASATLRMIKLCCTLSNIWTGKTEMLPPVIMDRIQRHPLGSDQQRDEATKYYWKCLFFGVLDSIPDPWYIGATLIYAMQLVYPPEPGTILESMATFAVGHGWNLADGAPDSVKHFLDVFPMNKQDAMLRHALNLPHPENGYKSGLINLFRLVNFAMFVRSFLCIMSTYTNKLNGIISSDRYTEIDFFLFFLSMLAGAYLCGQIAYHRKTNPQPPIINCHFCTETIINPDGSPGLITDGKVIIEVGGKPYVFKADATPGQINMDGDPMEFAAKITELQQQMWEEKKPVHILLRNTSTAAIVLCERNEAVSATLNNLFRHRLFGNTPPSYLPAAAANQS